MQDIPAIGIVALAAPLFPALAFVILGIWMIFVRRPNEKRVARLVSVAFTLSVMSLLSLAGYFIAHDDRPIVLTLGSWFSTEGYGFEAALLIDRLSVPMMVLTAVICGVIGRFSVTYLVLEKGQPRFYLLLSLFASGMFLLVMAGSVDLLIAGWEVVGLTSMLLIAFFQERSFPVRNALRAFVIYRVCDIGLLSGAVLLHHYGHTTDFALLFGLDRWPTGDLHIGLSGTTLIGLSFLWAASGKSALFPVGSWLPRAMEGPTPSSASFYGALSVHAGAYLMLRMSPILEDSWIARLTVVAVGTLTAVTGTMAERVQTDVKSQLAYATSTQVGVIFVEIGLGFPRLALVHLMSHAMLRTLQMLHAPNAIQDAQRLHTEVTAFARPIQAVEVIGTQTAPETNTRASKLRIYLYHLALERFHLDTFWERMVALPIVHVAELIERGESRWVAFLSGSRKPHIDARELPAPGKQVP